MKLKKTLRDELAMAALQGMMAHGAHLTDCPIFDVAKDCYDYADAMLEARLEKSYER